MGKQNGKRVAWWESSRPQLFLFLQVCFWPKVRKEPSQVLFGLVPWDWGKLIYIQTFWAKERGRGQRPDECRTTQGQNGNTSESATNNTNTTTARKRKKQTSITNFLPTHPPTQPKTQNGVHPKPPSPQTPNPKPQPLGPQPWLTLEGEPKSRCLAVQWICISTKPQ